MAKVKVHELAKELNIQSKGNITVLIRAEYRGEESHEFY